MFQSLVTIAAITLGLCPPKILDNRHFPPLYLNPEINPDWSIREALSEKQRHFLLLCHAFTGCDTVSAISGHGKTSLCDKFCAGEIDKHLDVFLDLRATKDAVIRSGIAIFQYICIPCTRYHFRYSMFSRKAAAGLKPYLQHCTAFSSFLPANAGLDAATEHVFGPHQLWMGNWGSWF